MLFLLGLLLGLAGCDRPSGYVRKSGQWRYGDVAVVPEDTASFKPLNESFARDARRGYYRDQAIADSDGPSFEALGEHEARDRRAVYYADTYRKGQEYWSIRHLRVSIVRDADPASYRLLAHGYARDRQRAFFEGTAFTVRDVDSFTPLNTLFAKDKLRGYYRRVEIAGSDGATFSLVDDREDHYARDARQVYHTHVDPDDPQFGARPVVRVLRGADPASFQALERGYARDAAQVWYEGTPLTRDVAGFELLPRSYARTSKQVFYQGKPVAGADAASFSELEDPSEEADARDRNRRYLQGARVAAGAGGGTGGGGSSGDKVSTATPGSAAR